MMIMMMMMIMHLHLLMMAGAATCFVLSYFILFYFISTSPSSLLIESLNIYPSFNMEPVEETASMTESKVEENIYDSIYDEPEKSKLDAHPQDLNQDQTADKTKRDSNVSEDSGSSSDYSFSNCSEDESVIIILNAPDSANPDPYGRAGGRTSGLRIAGTNRWQRSGSLGGAAGGISGVISGPGGDPIANDAQFGGGGIGGSAGIVSMLPRPTMNFGGQQKSVYDLEIGKLAEKPWRERGADISDYFNYGFTEETWKIYCERQVQMRLEASMLAKIKTLDDDEDHPKHDKNTNIASHVPPPMNSQQKNEELLGKPLPNAPQPGSELNRNEEKLFPLPVPPIQGVFPPLPVPGHVNKPLGNPTKPANEDGKASIKRPLENQDPTSSHINPTIDPNKLMDQQMQQAGQKSLFPGAFPPQNANLGQRNVLSGVPPPGFPPGFIPPPFGLPPGMFPPNAGGQLPPGMNPPPGLLHPFMMPSGGHGGPGGPAGGAAGQFPGHPNLIGRPGAPPPFPPPMGFPPNANLSSNFNENTNDPSQSPGHPHSDGRQETSVPSDRDRDRDRDRGDRRRGSPRDEEKKDSERRGTRSKWEGEDDRRGGGRRDYDRSRSGKSNKKEDSVEDDRKGYDRRRRRDSSREDERYNKDRGDDNSYRRNRDDDKRYREDRKRQSDRQSDRDPKRRR